MRNRGLLWAAALLVTPAAGAAQTPPWVDTALAKAGVRGHYELTSTLNPEMVWGDFDGDGFTDVALGVVAAGTRTRGFIVIHRVDGSVHVLGAGHPVGNGRNAFPADARIDVEHVRGRGRDLLRSDGWGDWHGWFAWTGQTYVWVQDTN